MEQRNQQNPSQIIPQYNYPSQVQEQYPYTTAEDYEQRDISTQYGSIIKDLTDTDKILEEFEMRIVGKKYDSNNKLVDDPDAEPYIKKQKISREFMNIIRSQVNRHNDFSFYEINEVDNILFGANYTINRWLMLQGTEVPLRYRSKLSFEAMGLISASLHKAMNGRMLTWTKGSFQEGRSINDSAGTQSSIWDYVFPFKKKNK